jgi:signal transduction histidine kinase
LAAKADTLKKEEIVQYANSIYAYASNFEKLINDLLSWSHLQIGHFTYEPKAIKVCEIIEETLEIFSVNAEEKGITVSTDCQACPLIFADENMVKSIFRNLLSNAIKFTNRDGKIEMCTEEKGNEVLVRISDDGVGMTDRIRKRLFKIDQQAIAIGNGLGLLLVKEFVEKHGGKIWFESEIGKGTTFYLTLPLTRSEIV